MKKSKRYRVTMIVEDMQGKVNDCLDCPIVRAVKRKFPNDEYVSCGFDNVTIARRVEGMGETLHFRLSRPAINLQQTMYDGHRPEPITFTMTEEK